MKTSETCRDQTERRRRIRAHVNEAGEHDLNGIDYVEVDETQLIISVHFLDKAPANIETANVRISGGTRIRDIQVKKISICEQEDAERDDCLQIEVDKFGDFSTYTLCFVNAPDGQPTDEPLAGFDPRYACIDFSFKANCPSDFDCLPEETCTRQPLDEPEIDYLAKDYASFRQLILDRLALIMPDWKEWHAPDLGIALVELLAYVGDYLSYYQDAVATEAYLDTARQRISVRRHAVVVDYRMHEGCNARAWVCVETDQEQLTFDSPKDVFFITGYNPALTGEALSAENLRGIPYERYEVFEPLGYPSRQPIHVYAAHKKISFYTWGNRECCLPLGATSATLRDEWSSDATPLEEEPRWEQNYWQSSQTTAEAEQATQQRQKEQSTNYAPAPRVEEMARRLHLKVGDVLIFEEVLGPRTGDSSDADPTHRHTVRLTKVEPDVDRLYDPPVPVLNIEWAEEDGLPFKLCISSIGRSPECAYLEDVSIARGNVILCDHGRSFILRDRDRDFKTLSERFSVPSVEQDAGCAGPGEPREPLPGDVRFRPRLRYAPLTYRAPFPAPSVIARHQAQSLGTLIGRVRARVQFLWKQAGAGQPLSKDEFAELRTIFGSKTLAEVGLSILRGKHLPRYEEQAEALQRLLERLGRYLMKKENRLKTLSMRGRAGYILSDDEIDEIGEMFGVGFAAELSASNAQMFGPARFAFEQNPREALPCIRMRKVRSRAASDEEGRAAATDNFYPRWYPRYDLLESSSKDRHFVAEIDNDGRANLRFGDGEIGSAPEPETTLRAAYRVGNGSAGNVGAEAIKHVVLRKLKPGGLGSLRARNPLPAQGGINPEPLADVKLFAPHSFRKDLQRAITSDDYARLAERGGGGDVQRAASVLRWSGSWQEVQVAIDPRATTQADRQLLEDIESSLGRYRRIGHDIVARQAFYVPLDIALLACVKEHYKREHVKAALLDAFSNRVLPGGRRGLFHPDNLSFGEGIYLSRLVAAAMSVEGVETVQVTKLQRLFEGPNDEIEYGVLPLGPLEVARLDNDRNAPENGRLVLELRGGQ